MKDNDKTPLASSSVESMGTRQLAVLREENARLQANVDAMIAVARDNEALFKRFHRLVLELIRAPGYMACVQVVDRYLREEFDSQAVTFVLFRDAMAMPDGVDARFVEREQMALFDNFMRAGRSECGRGTPVQLKTLFGDYSLEVRSIALIPLGSCAVHGFMAIGSTDKNRFHPELGTVFLDQLGDLISARIEQCAGGSSDPLRQDD